MAVPIHHVVLDNKPSSSYGCFNACFEWMNLKVAKDCAKEEKELPNSECFRMSHSTLPRKSPKNEPGFPYSYLYTCFEWMNPKTMKEPEQEETELQDLSKASSAPNAQEIEKTNSAQQFTIGEE